MLYQTAQLLSSAEIYEFSADYKARFEVLTALFKRMQFFRNVTPCRCAGGS